MSVGERGCECVGVGARRLETRLPVCCPFKWPSHFWFCRGEVASPPAWGQGPLFIHTIRGGNDLKGQLWVDGDATLGQLEGGQATSSGEAWL